MSPVYTKFPGTPSQDPSHSTLYSFLNNSDVRKIYNLLLRSSEKFAKSCAKIWFLEKCIHHKVIPRTLRITNRPNDESLTPEWTAATESTCLEWLRLALEKEEVRKRESAGEMADKHNLIAALANNDETIILQLREKLLNKGNHFNTEELKDKEVKLNNLIKDASKPKKPIKPPKKTKRKWVPKNKYKKQIKKKKREKQSVLL